MLTNSTNYNSVWADPSESLPTTLVVQQEPVIAAAVSIYSASNSMVADTQYLLRTLRTGTLSPELGLDYVQTTLQQLDRMTTLATITHIPNR